MKKKITAGSAFTYFLLSKTNLNQFGAVVADKNDFSNHYRTPAHFSIGSRFRAFLYSSSIGRVNVLRDLQKCYQNIIANVYCPQYSIFWHVHGQSMINKCSTESTNCSANSGWTRLPWSRIAEPDFSANRAWLANQQVTTWYIPCSLFYIRRANDTSSRHCARSQP